MADVIQADAAPRPVGAYPHARRVGDLLLLSGIGPRDPATNAVPGNVVDADGMLITHDIAAQTRAVFANVRAVLDASGARWDDLVDVTVYLTDMASDFAAYNAVWADYFPDPATAPCRTTLGISALPTPIAIELKCIAAAGREPTPLASTAGEGGTFGSADGGVRAPPAEHSSPLAHPAREGKTVGSADAGVRSQGAVHANTPVSTNPHPDPLPQAGEGEKKRP